jgi:uncharacterized protein YuzE
VRRELPRPAQDFTLFYQGVLSQQQLKENSIVKIYYDPQVDALYLELRTLLAGTATARDLAENVTANYAPDGQLAGLEILDVSTIAEEEELHKMVLEISPIVQQREKSSRVS